MRTNSEYTSEVLVNTSPECHFVNLPTQLNITKGLTLVKWGRTEGKHQEVMFGGKK